MQTKAVGRLAVLASLLAAAVQPAHASGQDVRSLTQAYNGSGQALFQELARKPGNIVISPYSIGAAMAMTRAGARGETERQMTKVLKHNLALPATDAANAALLAILDGYGKTSEPVPCPEGAPEAKQCAGQAIAPSAKLVTANALMLLPGRGKQISGEFRALVSNKYGGAIHEDASLDAVNGWVRQKTEGKIDRIVDRLDDNAVAVLLNAVYLNASWASPFLKGATQEENFNLSGGQQVRVPMMHQQAPFALVQRAGYHAIRIDYVNRSLGMVIVLPDDVDGLGKVAQRLDATEVAGVMAALKGATRDQVALALPRFKAEFKADGLVSLFKAAGMTLAFDPLHADFNGMTGAASGAKLNIDDIKHRATIEVTEPGTEAAAATAVVIVGRGLAARDPKTAAFVVDRPFLFYVVDDASGAILFQGRITDPRQSS